MDRSTTRLFAIVALALSLNACAHGSPLDRVQQKDSVAVNNKQLWPATNPPLERGAALDREANPYLESIFGADTSSPAKPRARAMTAPASNDARPAGALPRFEESTPGGCQPDNDSPLGPIARQYLEIANRWTDQIKSRFFTEQQWIADDYTADLRCGSWVIKRWVNDKVYTCEPECAFRTVDPLEWLCKHGFNSPLYWEMYIAIDRIPFPDTPYSSVVVEYNNRTYTVPLNDPAWFNRYGLPQPLIMAINGPQRVLRVNFRAPCQNAEPPRIVGWNIDVPGRIHPGPKP